MEYYYDEQGWIARSAFYRDGLLEGEERLYGDAGHPLFALPRERAAGLERNQLSADLRQAFADHGVQLFDDALVETSDPGREYLVTQTDRSYTARLTADRLEVYPGRLVEKSFYRDNHIISRNRYEGGWLESATQYDDMGSVARVVSFHLGRLDGPMTLYEGGLPTSLVTFKDGEKQGQAITYDEQGRPALVSHYQDGLLDGEVWVYKGGHKQAMATYRGDKKDGPAVAYYPSGREHLVAQYKAGMRDGESLVYGEDGQLVQKSGYKADLPDGESLLYDHDGHLVKQASYQAGKLQGEVVDYFASGMARKRTHYLDGKLHGVVFLYAENGRVKETRYYRNGQQVGAPERPSWLKTLFEKGRLT
jgi:antitoxin component YwqK of YwqJK toxin-antitoxin module